MSQTLVICVKVPRTQTGQGHVLFNQFLCTEPRTFKGTKWNVSATMREGLSTSLKGHALGGCPSAEGSSHAETQHQKNKGSAGLGRSRSPGHRGASRSSQGFPTFSSSLPLPRYRSWRGSQAPDLDGPSLGLVVALLTDSVKGRCGPLVFVQINNPGNRPLPGMIDS